jgi:hypothetical protein
MKQKQRVTTIVRDTVVWVSLLECQRRGREAHGSVIERRGL